MKPTDRQSLFVVFRATMRRIGRRLTFQCTARSPEGLECVKPSGHDGPHYPNKGSGWVWRGDYGD